MSPPIAIIKIRRSIVSPPNYLYQFLGILTSLLYAEKDEMRYTMIEVICMEKYLDKMPVIAKTAKVFSGARVVGDVTLKDYVGVWFNAVLRGDMSEIVVGENTNIQDGVIVHTNTDLPTIIGKDVTIGHNAIVHAVTIEDGALIGMGSIILDGAVIGKQALVGAGCLVPPGKKVPERTLVVGNPMKIVKTLSDDELDEIRRNKDYYVSLLSKYHTE